MSDVAKRTRTPVQFIICSDSCFQSTGPHKEDVIHQRGRKFSEKHGKRNKYENNRQQNTLFELRRPDVPVLDANLRSLVPQCKNLTTDVIAFFSSLRVSTHFVLSCKDL